MAELSLDPSHTALLIADFYAEMMNALPHAVERQVIDKTQSLQRAARDASILVCYCATVFRPGYLEISDRNKMFSERKRSDQPALGDPVQLIHPAVTPIAGEVVVEDCCSDADLDVHDFLTQRIFPRQTEVMVSQDVIQTLMA